MSCTNNVFKQLLAHGRWFSPGTLTYSTTKTGRHDIAEILLKVALSTNNQINQSFFLFHVDAANRKQTVNIATRGTM
jgi:hypothetical protein